MTLKLALLATIFIASMFDSRLARCCIPNESIKRGGVSLAWQSVPSGSIRTVRVGPTNIKSLTT